MSATIKELAISGGPHSGKSSILPALVERLANHGWQVYAVPEWATALMASGVEPAGSPEAFLQFERSILMLHEASRAQYRALALASGKPTVIVYDRAENDLAAYCGDEVFAELAAERSMTPLQYAQSYDGVLFLRSTAVGVPELFSNDNNQHRSETVEEAAALDERLLHAWLDAHLAVVDNSTDWDGKVSRALNETERLLGIPASLEIERKFLLPTDTVLPEAVRTLVIEQRYLQLDNDTEVRIRRRINGVVTEYFHTTKRTVSPGVREEIEVHLDAAEGLLQWDAACPVAGTRPVHKERSILLDGRIWEADRFLSHPGLMIVEVELPGLDTELALPSWLTDAIDVTTDTHYANRTLAGKAWEPRAEHRALLGL
jgi:CYTH domain-containing protein/predicted ATPase